MAAFAAIPIVEVYVFESDVESHVNADELSELSDVFDDELPPAPTTGVEVSSNVNGVPLSVSSLSLDDIPYDRDLKWVNVPVTSRPRNVIFNPEGVRMLKVVESITSGQANEPKSAGARQKRGDEKKRGGLEGRGGGRRRELADGAKLLEQPGSRSDDGARLSANSSSREQSGSRDLTAEVGKREPRNRSRRAKDGLPDGSAKSKSSRTTSRRSAESDLPLAPTPPSSQFGQNCFSGDLDLSGSDLNPTAREFVPSFLMR